ncbi:substrate-binding domain-containing protein [Candidatus Omnitrophota bacterium]
MLKRLTIFIAAFLLVSSPSHLMAREVLRLATTTSTYETGLLDHILPKFEQDNNCKVHIISVGTGKAITLARNGDVDIMLAHARKAEEEFVNEGYGVKRHGLMRNSFVILGPKNNPAKVSDLKDIKEALKRVYNTGSAFVSRGDDSGTDKKEKSLWQDAGLKPDGSWYLETGQGMGATLRIADEKDAYLLVDKATFLFNEDKIGLIKLIDGDKDLVNSYGVIAVNPEKHPHVNYKLSLALIEWLTSQECKDMINSYKINNNKLFIAD